MGSFISQVRQISDLRTNCPLINLSLAKIRELHGGFKSICDNFAVNLTEFENIFSQNEATFAIWDSDNNGLIDALELFAGIIIFADSKAEDKIRFIFDLFDFNEIQSLSIMDLEFSIQCVLISTSKIFGVGDDVSDIEITNLVRSAFPEGARITLPQLLKWCSHTDEVMGFFKVFRMEGPEFISQKPIKESEYILYEKHNPDKKSKFSDLDKQKVFQPKSAALLINNKRSQNFRNWLHLALQPIISYRLENKTIHNYIKEPDEIKAKLEWVYGIRCADTKRPLQYVVGKQHALSTGIRTKYEKKYQDNNDEMIYFVASVIVIFNPNINTQKFYLQHDQEVLSLAVSNENGDFIASGELADHPKVHIWNCRTLENLNILKGIHRKGIHLLAFSNNDRFLVTCGLQKPSAVVIYEWRTSQVMISTSIASPTQDIFILPEIVDQFQKETQKEEVDEEVKDYVEQQRQKNNREGIVIVSLDEIVVFIMSKSEFSTHYINFQDCEGDTDSYAICGMSMIADHKNQFYKQTGEFGEKKHIILTGHKDGKVLIWKLYQYIGILADYKDEITCISKCYDGVAVSTLRGMIYIWDNYLLKCTKIIELSSLPFKIISYSIVNIDFNQKKLLVLTLGGDVIEIQLNAGSSNKLKSKRVNSITKLVGPLKAMTILNQVEKTVMIAGDNGIVCSYDLATHELIDVWSVGSKITALGCLSLEDGGFIVAAGTNDGNLIIRQDWEEIVPRHHECGIKTINDIKFSKNGALIAVASTDKNIYLLKYEENDYSALAACKLDSGFPIALNFSEDSSKIVICTNMRKLLLLDPTTFQLFFKVEEVAASFWSSWLGRYPLITKQTNAPFIPVCLGNLSNLVVAADENGNVFMWKSVESIKDNVGLNFTGHTSQIQRADLTIDDRRLLSMGLTDNMLCQWRIDQLIEESTDTQSHIEEYKIKVAKIILENISLINEVNFCYAGGVLGNEQFKDNTVLVRGSNSTTMNKILSKLHFDYEDKKWMKQPAMSLQLEHIYGVQTADRRNTVMYVHFQGNPEQNKTDKSTKEHIQGSVQTASEALGITGTASAKLDLILPKILGPNYQGLIESSYNQTLKYDFKHQICSKFLVYFVARFCVVFNTGKNTQSFYQGHSLKVSAICKHPKCSFIASGEVNINPNIHIWDATTLETIIVLKTSHRGGVLNLTFSGDGNFLVSIGMDKTFSLQVFQWRQNRTLCFRNTSIFPIFDIKFNPYDNSQFVTCGYEHMAVWKIKGSHLSCVSFQKLKSLAGQHLPGDSKESATQGLRSILLCMDFISYKLGTSVQSDIFFGSNLGEVSTYCGGKHIVLKENAHNTSINCIRVTDSLTDRINILTGCEDGQLKIWDASFTLIQVFDMKNAKILTDLTDQRAFGIQSLDIYICDRKNPKRVLVGMRCGEVLEAIVSEDEKEEKKQSEMSILKQRPNLNFNFNSYISSHSSLYVSTNQKKVFIAMHPEYSILASVGDDHTLRFWDIIKHQILVCKNIGAQATSLSFSPDGSFLAIGLVNGLFLILNSKIEKLNFGTFMEDFTPPKLDLEMSPKESKSAVLMVKFSNNGDFLAVSYDNEHREEDHHKSTSHQTGHQKSQSDKKETSFVLLYVNRLSPKNPGIKVTSKEPYVRFQKIVLPLLESSASIAMRNTLAVTQLDFDRDDSFIEMTSQKVLPEHIRDYQEGEDFFVVWDIQANQIVSDYDQLKKVDWPRWSLSNSINARFQGNFIFPENPEEEKKLRLLEQCQMTAVNKFQKDENAICGSYFGDLYLFRFPSMFVDRNHVIDFRIDKIKKIDMALTRSFSAHTSMVQCVEIFGTHQVFSTALSDQCILQWRVEYEDQDWELDYNKFNKETMDPFGEVPSAQKFKSLISEIWNQRLEVAEINQGVNQDEFLDPACELQLETVIGRRAYDRKNNVKIDCQDRILYNAGSLMVYLQENDQKDSETPVKQSFLRIEEQRFTSISPEISTFALSEDRRLLIIGTAQVEANIMIWEISTNLQIARLILPNCSIVLYMKMAHDSKHILIIGLTKDYLQVIMIMDYTTQNVSIYRQIIHSLPYKIKDVAFYPGSTRRFVTCGIQHMCFWRQSGRNLESQIGELTIPKTFANLGGGVFSHDTQNQGKFGLSLVCDEVDPFAYKNQQSEEELENIFVSFLSMAFLKNTLVASGDDGFLYLWEDERIIRRVFAHEGSILAIDCNSKVGLIVSGGMEGNVVLWRLLIEPRSNIKSLDKLKTFVLAKHIDPAQAVLNPEFNVQSVCFGYNRIVIGTRSGSIFESKISDDNKMMMPVPVDKQGLRKWIRCIDHETPKSIAIDMISSRIYTLTKRGFFSVWDLITFDVIFTKNFHKPSKALYSFKLSNRVMLVFENEIAVLDSNKATNTFDEMPSYKLPLNKISDAKLNHNEKILGVATTSAAAPEVTLYDTDNQFTKMKTLYGFKSSIKYIDFSTDNYYLQCEDNLGEVLLFEIETQRVIHTEAIDFELEWLGEGLRSYSQLKGIHYWYGHNKITQIAKVIGRPIVVVGDELGIIRLFNYPNVTGEGYYQCYADHLFVITQCIVSPDRKFLISTSEMDRCIFKWRFIYNLDKIKRLQEGQ